MEVPTEIVFPTVQDIEDIGRIEKTAIKIRATRFSQLKPLDLPLYNLLFFY